MFHLKLTAMRYDDSKPFFWESTDPEIVEILEYVENKTNELSHLNIKVTKTLPKNKSDNFVMDWYFKSQEDWLTYKEELEKGMPDGFNRRDQYFENNNHFLIASVFNDSVEISSTMLVPKN